MDPKGRTVTGYFSAFGNEDSDGDIIRRGAYRKTLREWGPAGADRILHLKGHDVDKILGKPRVLREDSHGLYFETTMPDTQLASDVLILYQEGVINEHSVGIDVVSRSRQDRREIREVRLWEGSAVAWGANADTPTAGIKSRLRSALKEPLSAPAAAAVEGALSCSDRLGLLKHLNRELRRVARKHR